MPRNGLLIAAILAVGLAVAGWFVGDGFVRGRVADRYVTVKGLSEREVPADLAIWPLTFTVSAPDLETLHKRLASAEAVVEGFLTSRFPGDEVRGGEPQVEDRLQMGQFTGERYSAETTVTLRTGKVAALHDAMAGTAELVKQGVALRRSWERSTSWMFTGLEAIKPAMIAEATRDARRAAEQFARDADSEVGAIRHATQGYFSIEDRDPFSPEVKRVRVVTSVSFLLE